MTCTRKQRKRRHARRDKAARSSRRVLDDGLREQRLAQGWARFVRGGLPSLGKRR